ncbi:hypothetical protein QBC36DRAFT_7856 [Triangularia setosa]|uniref:Uncharacterized protein n=1 Tax=Triangularia setosa TaxID=2587417 RepID=A0AAN6W7N5_9PEZI|nr:hypothetical protein QBC36DRAFT_7856 [Podospora setosa]
MTTVKLSPLQHLPSEILILIFEANLGHVTSFSEVYAIWLSSHCMYYRFHKEFMVDLFLQHLQHGLPEMSKTPFGNRAWQWEHMRLEGIFKLVVDACQNDEPEFLQRAMTRYPDFLNPLARLELRFHLNSPCSSPWRSFGHHAPSMLHSILLVEYAALMDAPRTAQLLLSHRASIYERSTAAEENYRRRAPCKSYYLQPLVNAILATEELDEEQADAALLATRRFGLPRTAALVTNVIALDEKGNSGADSGSGPASGTDGVHCCEESTEVEAGDHSHLAARRCATPPPPRNRLLPQPREVAARGVVSGVLQSMKLKRDFTLYHTDLPVATQRTTGHHLRFGPNPNKLLTPLALRWTDLTSHGKLTGAPDDVPSIGDSSPGPGNNLAVNEPRATIESSPRASVPGCAIFPSLEERKK